LEAPAYNTVALPSQSLVRRMGGERYACFRGGQVGVEEGITHVLAGGPSLRLYV
jgi:hypothetical protein